ncbi:DUF4148 domain-containing protein [Paraburkholderia madseniana]|uniref:DUF4148 domain-containing protein n=1 Tax=Paraburkholderia madseniana TaxID=2599607 RepID=UPI0035570463
MLVAQVATFAQSNQLVTRARVCAELIEGERAGCNPSDWTIVVYRSPTPKCPTRTTTMASRFTPSLRNDSS